MRRVASSVRRLAKSATAAVGVIALTWAFSFGQTTPVDRALPTVLTTRIGLCQCIDDRSNVDLRCQPGPLACENLCRSTHYAFVPLSADALKTCRPDELYVVLPNADGHPGSGAITVIRGNSATLLDTPYAGAGLFGGRPATVGVVAADVHQVFGSAIAARPALPRSYRVFFPSNSAGMSPDSAPALRSAIADIKSRRAYQVEVIGNTDTVASELANKSLSIDRAEAIRRALAAAGVNPRAISVSGRADRDLLVPTPPGVPEQRNRRVEIIVR